ncbi:hypothetical protein G7043_22065 [Lentzea sp. NEAU-D13]|uniref:SD-repeat containing protein B domain-containing protein n=1 Tax=Lentzea alba TaxID=2714351 RepID=A0A7C9VXN7_9PSEU|nr:carboxypeptidase-like regulatory domain-containing protein [Lentzea alba]NGY61618.1 hypothetical protein [Lentzea alba]
MLRLTALATAALLAFGGSASALAQDDPTGAPPTPTETVTPPSSTDPEPPASTEPSTPPPSSTEPSTPSTPPADPSTPPSETPAQPPVVPPATTVEPELKPAEQKPAEQKNEQQAEQAAPDLKLSVKFDKPEYSLGEPLGITVTVRNDGDAPANQIRFASEPFSMHLTTGVEDLVSRPSLAPGEAKTIKLGAKAQWGAPSVALTVRTYVEGATDKTPNDNMVRAEAKFVSEAGVVNGVLFEDRDGNGVVSPGEGIDFQSLRLSGGPEFPNSATTYDGGRFTMRDVPPGTYQVRYQGRTGMGPDLTVKPGQFVVVKKGETTEVALQAVPTLSRSLWIQGVSFDKPRYAKGDAITASVRLQNNGAAPITGLVAVCDPENDPATLDGTGDGWGDLRPDRAGVTIGAHETKTVTVTDIVPDVDYPTGKVYFACTFSVDGRNTDFSGGYGSANPGITAGVDVAGTRGSLSGRVLNNNGGGVNGAKVVAYNPANNRIVGQAETSWGGAWNIRNLPQGKIALQVVGDWKLEDGSPRRLVDVIAEQDVEVDLVVVQGPFVKDPTVFAPDLKVSVSFDRQTYDISEPVRLTIKVENIGTGTEPARGSWHGTPLNEQEPYYDYQELRKFLDPQIELWPGESKQVTVSARPRDGGSDLEKLRKLRYLAEVGTFTGDPNYDNNKAEASADVTWGTGSASVLVYGDRNLNGKVDAGEELANRKVQFGGGTPWVNKDGRTDASGRVRFTDLPAGQYRASDQYDRESGWLPGGSNTDAEQTAVVNPGDEGTATVRLVRPLSDELKATVKYDKATYQPGDTVGISVSITNGTAKSLLVKGGCWNTQDAYIGNDTAEWGLLHRDAAGVEIAAGATFNLHVNAPLPAAAADYGFVRTGCTFGPDLVWGSPTTLTTARVPGAAETFDGFVRTDFRDPKPVPNVKLVLLDPETKQPVASTTTDANGGWVFPDFPVGEYTALVVGPWRVVVDSESEGLVNVRGREWPSYIWVEPGPDVADPTIVRPGPGGGANTGTTPVAAIKNSDALANTGVSVLGLGLFGVLLVLAGAALRRKPTAPRVTA